jgi:hypothetical protein
VYRHLLGLSFREYLLISHGIVQPVITLDDLLRDHVKIAERRNKGLDQIKQLKQAFLAVDEIEIGFKNRIPLYLFGFLY